MTWIFAALLAACTGPSAMTDDGPAPTDPPRPSGDSGEPQPIDMPWCELTDNALRVLCTVTLDRPGPVTLELTSPDAPTRTFTSDEDATEHALTGWGLLADTEYTWRFVGGEGTVTTESLPLTLLGTNIEVTGAAAGFDAVIHPLACGNQTFFVMIDGEGRVIWYEPNDVFFRGSMNGYEWSQEHRTLLSVGGDRFLEQHVSGEEVLRLDAPKDFQARLHHDTDRWKQYRYLLFERRIGSAFVDGVHVFDGESIVGTWYMEDHFDVDTTRNGDWAHGNGLNVTDDGQMILSFLNFSMVVAVDGDPASDTFLEVLWHANGAPRSGLPGARYTAMEGAEEGFTRQHNATLIGDDLWVFDNSGQATSRAARLALDHEAGTMTVTGAWPFDVTCRNQGGALPVPGGVLGTCANAGKVWLFDEDATKPRWTLRAACGPSIRVTRAIPVWVR